MTDRSAQLFRKLPSVSRCLGSETGHSLEREFGLGVSTYALRELLEEKRAEIRSGADAPTTESLLADWALATRRLSLPLGRRAINASGILLHTGLGRAPLSQAAISALQEFDGYTILEVDLSTGERGKRETRIEAILKELTGCEAATVVNNNAAATSLVLRALARNREVIISRGQLIEIGGAFRMPDVMRESGCFLREIGTTNRTHLSDYEEAISEQTGAIMHVHCSNYRIHGFTGTPHVSELCALGSRQNLPVLDDLGSGGLVRLKEFGLSDEHLVSESISAGATLVCFSGDKLICGPQAGIICGKKDAIVSARRDPFFRMFRPDKLTLAALEATLLHFVNGDYRTHIPLYQMLSAAPSELVERAATIANALQVVGIQSEVRSDKSYTGGGALPDEAIPSTVLSVRGTSTLWASDIAKKLRCGLPSVFCRIHDGQLLFDMRTLLGKDVEDLCSLLPKALSDNG